MPVHSVRTPELKLPVERGFFYGGQWREPLTSGAVVVTSPSTGEELALVAQASAKDTELAIAAARTAFPSWQQTPPLERASFMRKAASVIRERSQELAMLDAADGGNPVTEMASDAKIAAGFFDFFAGLVTEMKGASIPMGNDAVNFSVREPLGVVARIVAFNHPFMFSASKMAAPLAAGNTVIIKPPEQAPLSGLRLAELIGDIFPPGVVNILTGGAECGSTLATHRDVAMVTLVGSVPTGRAIMKAASATLKPVLLELGGKNALIAFPDADPEKVAAAAVAGMNYTWCGQSCGSVSRLFLHDAIHDEVIDRMRPHIEKFKPGIPTDPATTMGALVSQAQYDKVLGFIERGLEQGAILAYGGKRSGNLDLKDGTFVEPTVFVDVTQQMDIASQEIFGPVQSVLRWTDRKAMLADVNSVEYGLTCAIFTKDITDALRTASAVETGYVWINRTGTHFLGAPFGGYKQSGLGKEECLAELLSFTQEKNIHVNLAE